MAFEPRWTQKAQVVKPAPSLCAQQEVGVFVLYV
jgi:hypothetical protein